MKYSIRIDTILRYKPIIDYIKEEKLQKILELGSGPKGIGAFLDIPFDGLNVPCQWCTDKEYELSKNMKFIQGNALDIPLESNTYDLVFSCDMLEHIPQKERSKAIQEAIRVCKKGGIVIFCFPCGFWGKLCDHLLWYSFKFLHCIYPKISLPIWLQEHIEMNYPKNSDTKHLYQKTNIMMEEYSANNVLFHWIVMWVDMIIDMSRLRVTLKIKKIREAITHKYLTSKISNKSIIPYRKYLIIHKK